MTIYAGLWGPAPFIDRRGNDQAAAVVTVFQAGTLTKATLYASRDKVTPLANPLPSVALGAPGLDVVGNGSFYADPGTYDLLAVVAGSPFRTSIVVDPDPADFLTLEASIGSIAATLAGLSAGAPSTLDTFLEAYNRFLADEAVSTALASQIAGKVSTTGGGKEQYHAASVTGAASIDLALGNVFARTLTGDTTLSFTGATPGVACSFMMIVTQDGAGNHLLSLPGSIVWAGSVPPVLATAAGGITVMSFLSVDGGATWIGFGSTLPINVANGYAGLDGSALLLAALLGTGTPNDTKFLRGDRTWQTIPNDILPWSMDGTLYVKTGAKRLYVESARTIVGVRFSVGTAPTGAAAIVDVNKNGTTIFTTQGNRPTVGIGANTSGLVANMDVTSLAAGDFLTVDVDVVGSTIPGADATVQVFVRSS